MNIEAILFTLLGIFVIAAAAYDWEFFMNHRKARFVIKLLGNRNRARILYVLVGVLVAVVGVMAFFDKLSLG
ncbi:MAG: Imm17 family immunity protein [Chloroflexota bacterium]